MVDVDGDGAGGSATGVCTTLGADEGVGTGKDGAWVVTDGVRFFIGGAIGTRPLPIAGVIWGGTDPG